MRCGMETCDLGACRPVEVAATELAVWTGSVGDYDGGLRIDAVDAGAPVDAVTPADAWDCCGSRLQNVTASSCATGSCTFTCAAHFADCDSRANNGCERSLAERGDCGECGRRCGPGTMCQLSGESYDCV